ATSFTVKNSSSFIFFSVFANIMIKRDKKKAFLIRLLRFAVFTHKKKRALHTTIIFFIKSFYYICNKELKQTKQRTLLSY
ncbi:MAG: hypothetical protein RMJ44_12485, partial [Cytophagales bacterium]|nr:hypothetical protein [Cytophagales bacterium]